MTAVPISSPSLPYLPALKRVDTHSFTAGSTGEFSSRENSHHYLRRIRTHELPLSSLPCFTARPMSSFRYLTVKGLNSIVYCCRLSLTLSCPMNLRNYPFDNHECGLKVESCESYANPFLQIWLSCYRDAPVLKTDHLYILHYYSSSPTTSPTSTALWVKIFFSLFWNNKK